jgi:molecular chaperone GrpE
MLEDLEPSHVPNVSHSDDPHADQVEYAVTSEHETALEDWKQQARAQFERWLSEIDEIPEPDSYESPEADAFSVFAELSALRTENRKGNRKAAEVFAQFGETLARFQAEFGRLKEQLAPLKESGLPRSHCLQLAELLDRVRRLAVAMSKTPGSSFGGLDKLFIKPWTAAWDGNRQAVDILLGHLERLLVSAGLERISTAGKTFDPNTMVAVSSESSTLPPYTVLEEIQPGYLWQNNVLRPAEVKISKPSL